MKAPNLPKDEAERLQALHSLDLLDTVHEERFDRITRLTRHIFDIPIAVVSLVDKERQWFKSCIGLDVDETDRAISFCGHAILEDNIFIVSDTHRDQRFVNNPLVTNEPYIRFYAGYPLKAPNGHKIGSLCIIDNKPRVLNKAEQEILRDLAAIAEREVAITHLATIDELTNISNRRGFMVMAQHEINRCIRHKSSAVMAYFDLNNFKDINDQFGHAEGDKALMEFANIIKNTTRNSDIVGRIGGDEFVILFTDSSQQMAQEALVRCQSLLDEHNCNDDLDYAITYSYGLVIFDAEKHSTVEQLLNQADSLMYQHKQQGLNPD